MTAILTWTAWAWTLAADVPLARDLKADRGELSESVVGLPPEFPGAYPDHASGEGFAEPRAEESATGHSPTPQ